MLDFPLKLESTLFMNVRAMERTMDECARAKMPWSMCVAVLKEQFIDLSREQFLEVKYENAEAFCVRKSKERHSFWEYTCKNSQTVRRLLDGRSEPDFADRDLKTSLSKVLSEKGFDHLIGKEVRIKIDKIKKDRKDES